MPTNNDLYASIEELLASYRANLESRSKLTQEDEELIMQLSEAYLKKRQEWRDEALEEGKQNTLRSVALNLLRQGISLEVITQTTGFSIAQIEQLHQELKTEN
jgi:predicted transposase/invertase (TIGR01784 family)